MPPRQTGWCRALARVHLPRPSAQRNARTPNGRRAPSERSRDRFRRADLAPDHRWLDRVRLFARARALTGETIAGTQRSRVGPLDVLHGRAARVYGALDRPSIDRVVAAIVGLAPARIRRTEALDRDLSPPRMTADDD